MVDRYYRKIEDVENDIENAMQISVILLKLKEYDDKLGDLEKISTNEGNLSSNLSKLNNMDIDVKKDIYKRNFSIYKFTTNSNYKPIFDININFKFTKTGVIKINANYEYSYADNNKYTHIYHFPNNNIAFNETHIDHNSTTINDNFSIPSIECENVYLIIFLVNKNDNNSNITLYKNDIEIIYNDFTKIPKVYYNLEKITANEGNISSNLEKINDNKDDIIVLQNSNVKAFYNLDKIFIYDIEKGDQDVNKDNRFHIFEKEIIYNFVKDSYLEIILKVLTEI